jgi:ribonucleoside-diphosphate reductase alpha chain
MRNATVTTIAPTGTLSILANCSSGIEPIFAVAYIRSLSDGEEICECNEAFEEIAKKKKFWSPELCKRALNDGGIKEITEIPEEMKKLFATSVQIDPQWHVAVAAAFQKYTDNAVSKTVNIASSATKEDVRNIFMSAYKAKLKGITIFRNGCKKEQVLFIKPEDTGRICVESEFSGGCPVSYCMT